MKQAVIDTDIISYVIDERYPEVSATAKQYLRVFRHFTLTAITVTEVLHELHASKNAKGVQDFMTIVDECEILSFDVEESILTGEILAGLTRTGNKIGPLDPFIAANAIIRGLPLVTNNTKHYQRVIDLGFPLELENWRQA